jgi:hypothetical protein
MKTRLQQTDKGLALVIPREMLAACGIGEEANVILEHGTLRVAAPGWEPRKGWKEALAKLDPEQLGEGAEEEEALAHWNSLPEAPETPEVEPRRRSEEVLREEPEPYGRPEGQGGA